MLEELKETLCNSGFPKFVAGWKHPASLKTMDAWFSYPDILIKLEWDGLLNVERKKKNSPGDSNMQPSLGTTGLYHT